MAQSDVLIVGAGPTGLALALWLSKLGARVRVIDKTDAPGTTSRALAVHARTLELYRQLGLADAVIAGGHSVPAVGLWVRGERRARISFADAGSELTPYPFLHIFPQDEHEKLLIARLENFGVTIERRTELLEFSDEGAQIVARLRGPQGEERCEAAYIAGCDGAHSSVRQGMGGGFPGGAYKQIFYVADVAASGPAINGDLAVDLDDADFVAIFPLKGESRVRLIGTVKDERAAHADRLQFSDVSQRAIESLKVGVETVNWFSTYHVHHRVAEHFRKGRAFLLGDAAHIHSPAGGQGMNTGIGDAINLAWKLKAALDRRADDALLDSYEAERIPFANRLVQTTDRVFTLATAEGPIANFLRTRIAPLLLPAAVRFAAAREWIFRNVSQVQINYRGGPLSAGAAGGVQGGDRLPWVRSRDADNYASLATMRWQLHVYGQPSAEIEAWRRDRSLPLSAFDWSDAHAAAGLRRDALYLLRPDGYVALAAQDAPSLDRYFADRHIRP